MATDIRYTRKAKVGIKEETTRGTWNAPTASDLYEVTELSLPTLDAETVTWEVLRDTFTSDPGSTLISRVTGSFTFKTAIPLTLANTEGDTYTTEMEPLFKAAGYQLNNADPVFTFLPDDDSATGCSASVNVDGIEFRMTGCTFNFTIDLTVNQVPSITWTCNGIYTGAVEASATAGTAFSVTPEILRGVPASLLSDGTNSMYSCVKTFTVDSGNTLAPYECLSATNGVKFYYNTERAISATLLTGPMLNAGGSTQYDAELDAAFRASTDMTYTFTTDATPTFRIIMTGNITSLGPEEDNGVQRWNIGLKAADATAEGEIAIRFEEQ